MKIIHKTSRWITALECGVILFSASQLMAQDWPQWRGPQRDGKIKGFTAPEQWPGTLTQKWKTAVGSGDATPSLVGDKLYVFTRKGNEEVIQCLNVADGKEVWHNHYEAQAVTGAAARHPGPRSSPAVADGRVVTLGVGGVLSCFEADTGKLVWRKDEYPKTVPQFFTAMSPIIVDGMVVAQLGGKGKGAIIAFDLATGDQKWKWADEGPDYASPALLSVAGTKQLVTLTEKSVVGINVADGKLFWQIPFVPQGRAYNAATPIIEGDTVIVTGQGRGTKALKIEKQGDTFAAKELWHNPQLAVQYNTPVLKNGLLYGLSDKATFFCINAQTGQTAWTDTTKRGGNFGALVDAGSAILALPSNGELIVFKPNEKQYEEVTKYKVSESPVYAHPVVAGNRIFVKDDDSVTLWTL